MQLNSKLNTTINLDRYDYILVALHQTLRFIKAFKGICGMLYTAKLTLNISVEAKPHVVLVASFADYSEMLEEGDISITSGDDPNNGSKVLMYMHTQVCNIMILHTQVCIYLINQCYMRFIYAWLFPLIRGVKVSHKYKYK